MYLFSIVVVDFFVSLLISNARLSFNRANTNKTDRDLPENSSQRASCVEVYGLGQYYSQCCWCGCEELRINSKKKEANTTRNYLRLCGIVLIWWFVFVCVVEWNST